MEAKIKGLLGLAQRANKVYAGDYLCRKNMRSIALLVLSTEASERMKKEYNFAAEKFNIPLIYWSSKCEMGKTIGKTEKSVLGISDIGFAKQILTLTDEVLKENGGGFIG